MLLPNPTSWFRYASTAESGSRISPQRSERERDEQKFASQYVLLRPLWFPELSSISSCKNYTLLHPCWFSRKMPKLMKQVAPSWLLNNTTQTKNLNYNHSAFYYQYVGFDWPIADSTRSVQSQVTIDCITLGDLVHKSWLQRWLYSNLCSIVVILFAVSVWCLVPGEDRHCDRCPGGQGEGVESREIDNITLIFYHSTRFLAALQPYMPKKFSL